MSPLSEAFIPLMGGGGSGLYGVCVLDRIEVETVMSGESDEGLSLVNYINND